MKKNNLKGSALLVLTSLIWGLAFVAQSAASSVPSYLLNCMRSAISTVFLFALFKFVNRKNQIRIIPKDKKERKTVLTGAVICGIMLTISVNFQQFGIAMYPDNVPEAVRNAHAGFITALYVIIVPVVSVVMKKKIHPLVWAAVCVSLIGFWFLCLSKGLGGLYLNDLLILFCAVAFSFHILSVDYFVGSVGGIRLSMLQFAVVTVISGLLSLIFEFNSIDVSVIRDALPQIFYLGIMSSGVGYTLQIVGQKYAEPTVASIAMSLESVFAALGGWFVGTVLKIGVPGTLSSSEIIGCVLVFAAIIMAQAPGFIKKKI